MWHMIHLKSVFNGDLVSSIIIMLHSLFLCTCHVLTLGVLTQREIPQQVGTNGEEGAWWRGKGLKGRWHYLAASL